MKPRKTREELERKIADLEAQLTCRYRYAGKELEKAGDCLTGSAAILRVTALGGREIVAPVAILDGLSA